MTHRLPFRSTLLALASALALAGCAHTDAAAPGAETPELVVFGPAVELPGPVAHWHAPGCPHGSRWYAGRWVYWNDDAWEYVEGGRTYRLLRIDARPAGADHDAGRGPKVRRFPPKGIPYGNDVRPRLIGSGPAQ